MHLILALAAALAFGGPALAADVTKPHPHQGVATKFSNPTPTSLSAEEEATLASGVPIYRQVRQESGGRGVAIFDVKATEDKVWRVLTNYPSYPAWISQIKECEIYKKEAGHIFVRFKLGMSALGAEYYVDHRYTPGSGKLTWTLDYDRLSDLDDSTGYWLVYPAPGRDGFTRVEYTVDVRVGSLPAFIEDMVAKKGIQDATTWVKREAEK